MVHGAIPEELCELPLEKLHLAANALTGRIPTAIGKVTSLAALHLNENQISGPIPDGLSNLTRLKLLCLGGNDLTGTVFGRSNSLCCASVTHLLHCRAGAGR